MDDGATQNCMPCEAIGKRTTKNSSITCARLYLWGGVEYEELDCQDECTVLLAKPHICDRIYME